MSTSAFNELHRAEVRREEQAEIARDERMQLDGLRLEVRLRAAAERRPQVTREMWALLHEAATAIERLYVQVRQADARGDNAMRRAHEAEASDIDRLREALMEIRDSDGSPTWCREVAREGLGA